VTLLESLFGEDARILTQTNFQLLLLANILSPLGVTMVSPILDSLIGPFGTSPADIGLLMSMFTAPAIVMIPIAGLIADRVGRKPVLVVAILLTGTAGTAIAFTSEFRIALGLRFLQGVGFGGLTPIIITSIGDMYQGEREATGQGLRFTGSGLSSTAFPLFSGALVVFAWQYPFFLYALAFPIALFVVLRLEEPSELDDRADAETHDKDLRRHIGSLIRFMRQRRVAAMIVARGLPMFVWIGYLTYNSIVVVRFLDGTPAQAGLIVAVGSLAYASAASQAGRVTAFFDSKLTPLIASNLLLGIGFVLFLFAPTLWLAGISVVIFGFGFGTILSLYRSIVTGMASQSLRGGLVSVAESFGRLVATATPIIMGATISFGTSYMKLGRAIQLTGIGLGVLAAGGGILCLLVVNDSAALT
jgi:MFS family permease